MKILMAVTNDITTDQRVARSCEALSEAGHEVVLIGRRMPTSTPLSRPYRTERMRLLFKKGPLFYAEYNLRLFLKLLTSRADLFYANDADTLPAVATAARLRQKPFFYDAHELFSEVPEVVNRPRVKRVWEWIESHYAPRSSGAVTVCQSFATINSKRLGIAMGVVRNVPLRREPQQAEKDKPQMLLYQGAVNIGRGVDHVIEAMQYLPEFQFVVAGDGDELENMKQLAASKPWAERVNFLGRVDPVKLRQLTPRATMGLNILDNLGKNYYYTLPNRVGDFIAAGIPLLATDFPETARVLKTYGVGYIVNNLQPKALADSIRQSVHDWKNLGQAEQHRRLTAASNDLCWERDREVLIEAVEKAARRKK